MVAHGGAVGEGLYWAATTLFQRLGAHILVVLMFASGILLLTGTTMVSALGRTGRALRKAGTGTRDVARTVRAQRAAPVDPWEAAPDAPITISRERETDTFETERLAAELDDEPETIAVREEPGPNWATEDEAAENLGAEPVSGEDPELEPVVEPVAHPTTPMGRRRSRDGVTESEEVDYRLAADEGARSGPRRPGPGHARSRGDRRGSARVAAPLRGRGAAAGHGQRPAREPLRAPACPRDQGLEGRPAQGRPRLRARLDRHPDPRADPGQEGGRGRGPEPAPAPGPPRRHLLRAAEGLLATALLARQGRLRRGRERRPGADATRARRRDHRLGEVRLHQRDPDLDPHARLAERGAAGARRPEAGRAQPLRARTPPAHPGGHEPAAGGERAREPDRGDGEPLRGDERGAGAQPRTSSTAPARRPATHRCRTSSASSTSSPT